MTEPCCARFGAFHAAPAAFFERDAALDQDAQSRSRDGTRRVTVTARGLFLTRDLLVEHDEEEAYDARLGRHGARRWHHDTALGGLGLDAVLVSQIRGRRVLDVASGLAVFGTELSTLGADVDCVDLELDDAHPSFDLVRPILRSRYAEQLMFLRCLARHSENARYAMSAAEATLLDALVARARTVSETYPAVSGERRQGDATTLSELGDGVYDLVTSGWLMVHLEPDDERRAIASMIRVAKPGGQIHVRAGYGGSLADRVLGWFPGVTIIAAHDDLAVFQTAVTQP